MVTEDYVSFEVAKLLKEKGYEAVLYDVKDDVEIILQSFGIFGTHIFEDYYEQACESAIKYCLESLI